MGGAHRTLACEGCPGIIPLVVWGEAGLNPDLFTLQLCVPRGRQNLSDGSPHCPTVLWMGDWAGLAHWGVGVRTGVHSRFHLCTVHPVAYRPGSLEGDHSLSCLLERPFSGLAPLLSPSLPALHSTPHSPSQHSDFPEPPPEPPSLPSTWGLLGLLTAQVSNPSSRHKPTPLLQRDPLAQEGLSVCGRQDKAQPPPPAE